jgi:hypothetical protein
MTKGNEYSPILLTGIQRSGTTIIAKILSMCGASTGDVSEMFENKAIKKYVSEYYNGIGKDPQFPLPDTAQMPLPIHWGHSVQHFGGFDFNSPWMFKSSTNCQIWPVWNFAFPNAKWIIVRRRTGDIVSSCMKTAYMAAFKNPQNRGLIGASSEQEGWLWWVHQHEKLFVEMIEAGLNCKIIWPERMVNGDYSQIFEMLEWVGLQWNEKIVETIHPMLYNSKQKERK